MKNVVKKLFFLVFLHNKNRDIFNKARWKSYENIFFPLSLNFMKIKKYENN